MSDKDISQFQLIVGAMLRQAVTCQIMENHRPDWLFGMELDFYMPSISFAVEVNGSQHYQFSERLQGTRIEFDAQVFRDQEKFRICRERGIELFVISQHLSAREMLHNLADSICMARLPDKAWKYRRTIQIHINYLQKHYPVPNQQSEKQVRRSVKKTKRRQRRKLKKRPFGLPQHYPEPPKTHGDFKRIGNKWVSISD